jgi:hypothetical protein
MTFCLHRTRFLSTVHLHDVTVVRGWQALASGFRRFR